MNIGIYIYDQAEVLDFSGPFEVFSTTARLAAAGLNVFLVADAAGPVIARGGFSVNPHYTIARHPPVDVLVVAGGVHQQALQQPAAISWIASTAARASLVASVCTGAFLLAEAGLLEGCQATTHWEDQQALAAAYPGLEVIEGVRWVDAGKVVTSGGISAGIDMSLYLISRLFDTALAEKTARQMEFDWRQPA